MPEEEFRTLEAELLKLTKNIVRFSARLDKEQRQKEVLLNGWQSRICDSRFE
jgi:hypothetical protein